MRDGCGSRGVPFIAHTLAGEPVTTPDRVRGRLSPGYALARRIRVGNAEPRQDQSLASLHRFGLPVRFVIVAQKVEKAMQRQMGEVMVERPALVAGLLCGRLIG